ncbi:oligogalacturonate lyase family protein [Oleiharenicola sp. Vm1]|uniref:oligogalacturonate lyase family protein n=1 Tax=Oleiharenicola sp. Vm1 TaxID=3398393 RepID=UPI0039F5DAD4
MDRSRHRSSRHPPHGRAGLRQPVFQPQRLQPRRPLDGLHVTPRHLCPRARHPPRQGARSRPGAPHRRQPAHVHAVLLLPAAAAQPASVWRCDLDTGATRKLVDLPPRASVVTINADDTLGAGTFIEGDAHASGAYDGTPRAASARMSPVNQGEPANKAELMTRRLNAKLPMTLFTVDLATGKLTPLLQHDTNWLNHLQFSPTDPTLLLYCHEGHWHLVDRIWTIRTDGSQNQLVHRRTMQMEIAGHEWWGADGRTVYYQLHFPRGGRVSFIASANAATGERTWLQYDATSQSSIHDNSSPDQTLFCGDGDRQSPWLFLFRPKLVSDRGTLGEHLIRGGYLESEKLVDLARHNYRLEPNPMFTPDQKFIIFRSNLLGPDYVFAVEVAKAH